MAGAVAAKVALLKRVGQGLEGHFCTSQRGLFGGDVSVAELTRAVPGTSPFRAVLRTVCVAGLPAAPVAGQNQIRLAPEGDHGLVAPSAFVMGECAFFVTLDDGGVLIDGGDFLLLPILFEEACDLSDQSGQHTVQSLLGRTGRKDEALLFLAGRTHGGKVLVMETIQKKAHGTGLGRPW